MADEKLNIAEMSSTEIIEYEGDLMSAILRAAEFKTDESEYRRMNITRNGKILFKFLIRPLTEDDLSKCRKKNTRVKQGRFGIDREKNSIMQGIVAKLFTKRPYPKVIQAM